MKVAIIGAGNMGGALARGWAKSESIGLENVLVANRSQDKLTELNAEFPELFTTTNNVEAVKQANVVCIVVKPWLVENVVDEIKKHVDYNRQIIISCAAGVGLKKLEEMFRREEGTVPPLFYAIPNIAAEFAESMTFAASNSKVTEEQKTIVNDLFSTIGEVIFCKEQLVAPGMMIASCGIAYIMRYIRAQMQGGVEMGFYPDESLGIVLQTMLGAVKWLKETGGHPETAIDKVTTPGGVSIKGINELDYSGFSAAVIRALKAGLN